MPRNNKKPHEEYDGNNENLPRNPVDTNQRLNQPYQGYDKEKTNSDFQRDYDVDKNNSRERFGEYSDWNRRSE